MLLSLVPTPVRPHHASAPGACLHCGQAIPTLLAPARAEGASPGPGGSFCCAGCETAYSIIHSCGLDRYYQLRDQAQAAPASVKSSGRSCAEFDEPLYHARYVRSLPGGLLTTDFLLENVHCSACVWLVEKLPSLIPGVVESRLDFRRAIVTVTWNPAHTPLSRVAGALHRIGYPPHPARGETAHKVRQEEDRRQLVRLGLAGACAGNAMLFALALYAGVFDWMEGPVAQLFRWASMGVSVIALAFPGRVFFQSAWGSMRARTVHLDVPIALALLAGGVWSIISTIRGVGEIYFDSLSVLVFLLLVGRFIQRRQQRRAADAVELLFSLTPTTARIVEGDVVRETPVESLKPADIIEVRAGDSFPADGFVVQGRSSVDQSLLTGESRPVPITIDSPVAAGSVNLSATIHARVTAAGEETRVGKLMRTVEEASRRRAPIVRLADRAASWFLIGMLGLSLVTLGLWLVLRPATAIEHAVSLLVVTCPCALGLATPLAFSVAIGRAARLGCLIKGGDAIQRLARPGRISLDKTGTLTLGRLGVVEWTGDDDAAPLVAALEAQSSHPVALALTRDLVAGPAEDCPVSDVVQTLGGGIQGRVGGRMVAVGSPAYVAARSRRKTSEMRGAEARALSQGLSPVAVAVDGVQVALIALGDAPRPDAADAVERLRALGWQPEILSGDHPETVAAVASQLGITPDKARGGLSPEDKLAMVCQAAKTGPVVMVGDGVNDSAALAAAGVGIAVHGGAEASLAAADVYISRPGMMPLLDVLEGSRRTMRIVKTCLAISTFYNVAAAALAVAGLINPIVAAIFMPISSLTVLGLSLSMRSFGGRP